MLILKFYTVPVCLFDIKKSLNHKTLQSKHVSKFFFRENMTSFLNYVTATLRALLRGAAHICKIRTENDSGDIQRAFMKSLFSRLYNYILVFCFYTILFYFNLLGISLAKM